MERLVNEVRDGKLDYALTKPEDAQLLVSVREVRIWQMVDVVAGVIVLGVGIARLHTGAAISGWVAFAVLLPLGGVMIYCFWLILATGAFWIVRMWFLADLFEGVYQTGRWPIGIYLDWLRYTLTFLVPIGFAITVPAVSHHLKTAVGNRIDCGAVRRPTARNQPLVLAARAAALLWCVGIVANEVPREVKEEPVPAYDT